MRIQPIIERIQKQYEIYKYTQHQRFLNKYFKIINDTTAYDSFEKMHTAREVIANYAKHKGVIVEVSDPRSGLGEFASPVLENYLSDKMHILVRDKKNPANNIGRLIQVLDDSNPQKAVLEKTQSIMVHDEADGIEKIYKVKSFFEETFLRNLYRNIEELANKIKGQ